MLLPAGNLKRIPIAHQQQFLVWVIILICFSCIDFNISFGLCSKFSWAFRRFFEYFLLFSADTNVTLDAYVEAVK
jgi:hypothetical protein